MKKSVLILLISFLFCFETTAQQLFSKVKIPLNKRELQDFRKKEITDYCNPGHYEAGFLTLILSQDEINLLEENEFEYEILIEDAIADFLEKNKNSDFYASENQAENLNFGSPCGNYANQITTPLAFTPGTMGGYYTLAEMQQKLYDMIANYPSLISDTVNIGNSHQGRPVYMVKISDNPTIDEPEPEALYTAIHHAREPNSMMQMIFFMQYLLENYASNAQIKEIVDNRELYFIPCLNPDGYEYNRSIAPTGSGFHRKNRHSYGGTGYQVGVDLNRNYSVNFGGTGSSGTTTSTIYRGPSAFSEPETQNLKNFVISRNFTIAFNYHSYSDVLIRPDPNDITLTSLEDRIYNVHGSLLSKYNCYTPGTDLETLNYKASGVSDTWFFAGDLASKGKIFAYTPEVGTTSEGFWPPSSRIIPLAKDNVYANLQMASLAGSYQELEDWSGIKVGKDVGKFDFKVTRLGFADSSIKVSIIPIENIASVGAPIVIPSLTNPLDTYFDSLAYVLDGSIKSGDPIVFKWKIESGGISHEEEIRKIYKPTIMLNEDCEGSFSSNWNSPNGWNFTSSYALSGNNSLSESPTGNYPNNTSREVYLNSALDFSDATEAYLSFWVKHASEFCYDRLQIEYSVNGVGPMASYTPICGNYLTIQENKKGLNNLPALTGETHVWKREIVSLAGAIGKPNVGIRFRFISDNFVDDDGFYLDDIEIVKSPQTPLPIDLLYFYAQLTPENKVELHWQNQDEIHAKTYEIQRSKTGENFEALAWISAEQKNGSIYNFLDESVKSGWYFYRLKQIDLDGTSTYSKTIRVYITPKEFQFSSFPNPVQNELNIESDFVFTQAQIEVLSLLGQIVQEKQIIYNSNNRYKISLNESLENGTYLLKFSDGEQSFFQKFILIR